MINLNENNFDQEVIKEKNTPVLIDFYANWCAPCKMMEPVIEQLAKDYQGKIKVAKLDVDQNQALASQYGIMSIPAFLVFKNGKVIKQLLGAMPKDQLKKELDNLLD